MTANIVKNVTQATDLQQLSKITSEVLGKICWRANLSYGDELSLHIGARIPYSQKAMAGKEKGEWILGTRLTAWRIDCASETIATSSDEPQIIRQKVKAIENTTITTIETSYPNLALTVTFSNKCQLILIPETFDDSNLPYWELFAPYRMLLKVEPGAMWSYTRSNGDAERV